MNIQNVKFPKTLHLPWSKSVQNDDKIIKTLSYLEQCGEIVITLKMDGENTAMMKNCTHARSVDSKNHPSRNWIKSLHSQIKTELPDNYKFFGENLYATHSIKYDNLQSYFYLFHILKQENNRLTFLSWNEVIEWASLLNLKTVTELYRGKWDRNKIGEIIENLDTSTNEGIVIRNSNEIDFTTFDKYTAKWVRENHVQTDEHWMHKAILPNKLAETI